MPEAQYAPTEMQLGLQSALLSHTAFSGTHVGAGVGAFVGAGVGNGVGFGVGNGVGFGVATAVGCRVGVGISQSDGL